MDPTSNMASGPATPWIPKVTGLFQEQPLQLDFNRHLYNTRGRLDELFVRKSDATDHFCVDERTNIEPWPEYQP